MSWFLVHLRTLRVFQNMKTRRTLMEETAPGWIKLVRMAQSLDCRRCWRWRIAQAASHLVTCQLTLLSIVLADFISFVWQALLIVEKLIALYFFCHTLLIVEYLSCEVAVKLHWREGTAGKRNVHHWPLHLCIYCQHSNETNVKIEDRLLLSRGEQTRWCEVS